MPRQKPTQKTHYNRTQAAAILGRSARLLRTWELSAQETTGPLAGSRLFRPLRPGCAIDREPQYHRRQLELICAVLADWTRLAECEERWRICTAEIGQYTIANAEDLGLVSACADGPKGERDVA